jgi:hypothetical protein
VNVLERPQSGGAASRASLLPGAKIDFYGGPDEMATRIRLSGGTRRATDDEALAPFYGGGTFVPRKPWREATVEELSLLYFDRSTGGLPWRPSSDIAIIRVPEQIVANFAWMLEQHGIREVAKKETYTTIAKHPRWTENLAALGHHLERMTDGDLKQIFFRMTDPDQLTITKNDFGAEVHRQLHVGLHIDHWDRLPLRHRDRARNRICINLGREPRYSLFFNLPMMDMFRAAGLRDPEDIYADFRGLYLARRFMEACPDYPVVGLRLDPGEAYILPTDNLVHDASTETNRFTDITLTYLGLFFPEGLKPEVLENREPAGAG